MLEVKNVNYERRKLKLFITISIFLNILNIKNVDCSNVLNISNEIKSIFENDLEKDIIKDLSKTQNYAEGGLVYQQDITSKTVGKIKNFVKNTSELESHSQNIEINERLLPQHNSTTENKIQNYKKSNIHSKIIPVKLNDTGTNLFLGIPEVTHINGVSSIKPRKGVYYNKIVPRKGVGNENEKNYSLITDNNCSWLFDHECHNLSTKNGKICFCCKIKITQLELLNCNKCFMINTSFNEMLKCQSICCEIEKINITETYSIHNLNEGYNNIENHDNAKELKKKIIKKILPEFNTTDLKGQNGFKLNSLDEKSILNGSANTSKLKPLLTKVPYDVETVTNLLGNSSKEIIVPVAAFLFLLPMVGILIYFVWRRVKDYWERRYYKRMDYLIDGIYND